MFVLHRWKTLDIIGVLYRVESKRIGVSTLKKQILPFLLAFVMLAGCAAQPGADSESQEPAAAQEVAALQEELAEQKEENQRLQSELEALREELTSQEAEESEPEESSPEPEAPEAESSQQEVSVAATVNESSLQTATPPTASAAPVSSAAAAPAAGSSKSSDAAIFFANTNLAVYDWTTPAVSFQDSQGRSMDYISIDGKILGSISNGKVTYAGTAYTYDSQGAVDAFNDYRGVTRQTLQPGASVSSSGGSSEASVELVDTDAYAREVVRLANKEREAVGLDELVIDSSLMNLAAIRAEELAVSFSHTRPDGTKVSDQGYGENIYSGKKTASGAVNWWMNSSGHKANILLEGITKVGAGCYQDTNDSFYWVMIFSY